MGIEAVLNHTKRDLRMLWDVIKDKDCAFWGEYTGLKNVLFTYDLEEFKQQHGLENSNIGMQSRTSIVVYGIQEALEILSLNEAVIYCHHLSCASDVFIGHNTALCIHYRTGEQIYAIAIPGINYVPTKKTLQELKKRFGKNTE